MKLRLVCIAVAVHVWAVPALAQNARLTVQDIWGSNTFSSDLISASWTGDPRYFTITEDNQAGGVDVIRIDAITGDRHLLVSGSDLVPPGDSTPITIESYEFSPDGTKLVIFTNSVRVWRQNTRGEYYVWDLRERRLTPVGQEPGLQQFAKFSPDGKYVGFVRDNNIFVTEIKNRRERQLTFDGDDNIINGTSDWVYEEELGLRDAFRFSPDGKRIAFWRIDQTVIKPFYLIDELSLYPELMPVRYPKAGEQNSEVRLGVVEISSGKVQWIDLGAEKDIYIAEMDFANSPDEVLFTRLNRHQNTLELLVADVKSGASRVILTDTDDAWVDAVEPRWFNDGQNFLFTSERDGFNQVFLYERDGTLIRKVTTAAWDVTNVYGLDETRGVLYFSGAGDGPLKRPLYRVGLDGQGLTRLSSSDGSHNVQFNSDHSLYIDRYASSATPPIQTLHEADGTVVRTLADNAELAGKVRSLNLLAPEFIKIPVDGGVELNAYIIRPPDFIPGRSYPLLLYVYGGPGSQTVRDVWGGQRYLWHQMLAQEGYLVASVDNRGTGARGRDFKKQTYLNLGKYETADQIAAARYFGSMPFVDANRIGIWGWSYGGYMSLMSMFQGEGVFKTAISVAPVTDWRFYDTIYTERFMRTPAENPTGYETGAPINYVEKLQGNLLVVHGTGDDNVHAQNTTQLIHALEEAGKQFDMRIYPNKTHSIAGSRTRANLYEYFTRWLNENLAGESRSLPIP